MGDGQLIDSAPKDNVRILLWRSPWRTALTGYYLEGWFTTGNPHQEITPTHWKPLDPPPATTPPPLETVVLEGELVTEIAVLQDSDEEWQCIKHADPSGAIWYVDPETAATLGKPALGEVVDVRITIEPIANQDQEER